MGRMKSAGQSPVGQLREFGLRYPGAHTKSPWPGHLDLAVKDKTFAFLSVDREPLSISCKLPVSGDAALSLPFAEPTGYGLGRSGWVTASFPEGAAVPLELLQQWIDESYRAQAPRRLSAGLPELGAAEGAGSPSIDAPAASAAPSARATVKRTAPAAKAGSARAASGARGGAAARARVSAPKGDVGERTTAPRAKAASAKAASAKAASAKAASADGKRAAAARAGVAAPSTQGRSAAGQRASGSRAGAGTSRGKKASKAAAERRPRARA